MNSKVAKIQQIFDELNAVELCLGYEQIIQFIELLHDQLQNLSVKRRCLVLHFMCTSTPVASVISPKCLILRATTLFDANVINPSADSYEVDIDDQFEKLDRIREMLENSDGE